MFQTCFNNFYAIFCILRGEEKEDCKSDGEREEVSCKEGQQEKEIESDITVQDEKANSSGHEANVDETKTQTDAISQAVADSVAMPPPSNPLPPTAKKNNITEAKSKYFNVGCVQDEQTNNVVGANGGVKLHKVHCSVPLNNVKCTITNNVCVDKEVKKFFQTAVNEKI